MRVLITGAGGQLATDLVRHCETSGDDVRALTRADLDVGDRRAVADAVAAVRPDVVVNTAAWTAVDACESDQARAFRDNALAVRWLADACRNEHAHLVQLSTDYVFDGTKSGGYHEWDVPAPRSVYGASKLAGEREALDHLPGASVVRTSWVMGAHGHNMVKTVLGLRDRDRLAFVDDQRGRPSFTSDLAIGVRAAAASRVPGILHCTNQGEASWFELVREILAAAGADPDIVEPIATDDLDPPRPAPRPANSVLDGVAWRASHLPELPHYRDTLGAVVRQLLADPDREDAET